MISITFNGQALHLEKPQTLAELIATQLPKTARIAVERNGEIIPKAAYANTMISPNDRIEVVHAIGGG